MKNENLRRAIAHLQLVLAENHDLWPNDLANVERTIEILTKELSKK